MRKYKGFFKRYIKLLAPIYYSKHKKHLQKCSAYALFLIILQMVLAVYITSWTAGTFNAIEAHSILKLIQQLATLIVIFAGSITIHSENCRIRRTLQITIRTWLTETLIQKWMSGGAHLKLLQGETEFSDNPDGRIASDIRAIADGSVELATGLIYNLLLIGSFTAVLWSLSGIVTIAGLAIPGYLVWVAVAYAAVASVLGYRASIPLTHTTNDLNSSEADLRFALVEVKEESGKIALQKREVKEIDKLFGFVGKLKEKFDIQTAAWQRIVRFNVGYGTLNLAAPILAAAPRYIAGKINLGELMQGAAAFGHLVGALSWPVYAMPAIAVWRASVERVLNLIDEIDRLA